MSSTVIGLIISFVVSTIFEIVGISAISTTESGLGTSVGWAFSVGGGIGMIVSFIGILKSF